MTGQLYINKQDAYATWGVSMGDGFLDAILAPEPLKDFIENKSRLEHGKEVLYSNARFDERDLTLTFFVEGDNESDYIQKYTAFKQELFKGNVMLRVVVLGATYHLTYQRSASYAGNTGRTFSKISVKFNEPNPANRTNS